MTGQRTVRGAGTPVIGRPQRALAGLTDQGFTAAANALNALVAGVLLGPAAYGRYVASIGVAFITVAVARAFIGEVLLTHTTRARGDDYRVQLRDASATALAVGALAALVALGVWLIGFDLMADLPWLLPFLPAAMLADAGRYAFLARRRPQRSMTITGISLLVQLASVATLLVEDAVSPATLLVAWGLGTSVGAMTALTLLGVDPLRGRPWRWISTTEHLSTWFTATAMLSQLQNWVVLYFVGGFLGQAELGGLRMLQMLVLMPVQNLIWALSGMVVPGYSHFTQAGEVGRIRSRARTLVLASATGAVVLLLLVPAGEWLLRTLLPAYREFEVLVWPIALQAGLYLLQSPFNAALRGMQRARSSFVQYTVFAGVTVPASLTGAVLGGVLGATYGMVLGAAAGLLAAYVLHHRALREFARTSTGRR